MSSDRRAARLAHVLVGRVVAVMPAIAVAAVGAVAYFASAVPASAQSVEGLCDRTEAVRVAIVAAAGAEACGSVDQVQLSDIRSLDLSDSGITSLQPGDFDGLYSLAVLDLSGNSLEALPGGIFDELFLLRTLLLDGNSLDTVPEGLFDQLFLLEDLGLDGNPLTSLPEGMFDDLSRLKGAGSGQQAQGLDRLRQFLAEHRPVTPEDFIAALPDLHKERFVFVYDSEALGAAHVSYDHPRVISFGADGRFVFAWLTDPDAPGEVRDVVEFLIPGDDGWTVGVIDFTEDAPQIAQPEVCQACHGAQPKPLWPGFEWFGTEQDVPIVGLTDPESEQLRDRTMRKLLASTSERIAPLHLERSHFGWTGSYHRRLFKASPSAVVGFRDPAEELATALALRHAGVLFERLQSDAGYAEFAQDTLCSSDPRSTVSAPFWASRDHTLGVFPYTDRIVLAHAANEATAWPAYYFGAGELDSAVLFLILYDLWETHPEVRDLYRETSNADLPSQGIISTYEPHELLVYPIGEATAEDELIQLYRMHHGYGSRTSLELEDSRSQTIYQDGRYLTDHWAAHVATMAPRVCSVLQQGTAAPRVTSDAAIAVAEGSTVVAMLTATDADTDAADLVWSIPPGSAGGADRSNFTLGPGGVLALATPQDYETPGDRNRDGVYDVTVRVSDGGRSATADLEVSLSNVNEAPTAHAGTDQAGAEPGALVTLAGTGSDPDADDQLTLSWAQVSGPAVVLSGADTETATFRAPSGLRTGTTLVFSLTVTDREGLSHRDEVSVSVTADEQDLTAWTGWLPASHNGAPFSFELHFSEDIPVSYRTLRDTAFEVTGGAIVKARRHAPPSNARWVITVEPSSGADVVLVLQPDRACDTTGALCTSDGRRLHNRLEVTIAGSPPVTRGAKQAVMQQPLTARFGSLPAPHHSRPFSFEVTFSEEIAMSYRTLRDSSFEVTGGTIIKARRVVPPSNTRWVITVEPSPGADVALVLHRDVACDETGAVCTPDGRRLNTQLTLTVGATFGVFGMEMNPGG